VAKKPTPAKTAERVAYLEQQVKLLPKSQQEDALKDVKAKAKKGGGLTRDELVEIDRKLNTTLYGADARSGTAGRAPWLQPDAVTFSATVSTASNINTPTYTPPDVIVKTPTRDVVNFTDDSNIGVELITNLLFENLGANELVKFERHDTIEGTNANYDIISNLSSVRKQFDPANLISRQKPDRSYFDIFNIKLEDKLPSQKYLQNNPKIDGSGEINTTDYVYIDSAGNLVVELVNMNSDELVEVEIESSGTIYVGYEIDY
jgi:hypothetical protein